MQLEGIYTPVITPFATDLAVDYDAFGAVLDGQIDNGVHGIIIGGSTGEFYAMTPAERAEQLRFAAERINGRAALIAGVNDLRIGDCHAVTEAARAAGADALLVGAPPYSLPSAPELLEHCRQLAAIAGLPMILYNYPGRSGAEMDEAFLEGCAGIGQIVAIKESAGDPARISMLAERFPDLQLCAGAEDLVLEFFAWGARSWVSVVANFLPAQAVAFHRICVTEGDFDRGRRIMLALLPLMRCLEHGGAFIQSVKRACEVCGQAGGPARPPLLPLSDEQRDEVDRVVAAAILQLDEILNA